MIERAKKEKEEEQQQAEVEEEGLENLEKKSQPMPK